MSAKIAKMSAYLGTRASSTNDDNVSAKLAQRKKKTLDQEEVLV